MRARLVLLDADVVIEAIRVGAWDNLVAKVEVMMASTVIDQVTHEVDPETGAKHRIDLYEYVANGRVKPVKVDSAAVAQVNDACRNHVDLHHGELESLACLPDLDPDCRFCTGDKAAIKAIALLGMTDRAASLERVLGDNGIPGNGEIGHQFRDGYLRDWLRRGAELRAQTAKLG
jgi:hypothetical protein